MEADYASEYLSVWEESWEGIEEASANLATPAFMQF